MMVRAFRAIGVFGCCAAAWGETPSGEPKAPESKLWRPMAAGERFSWYTRRTTGTSSLLRSAASAGFGTIRGRPVEWERDDDGYMARFASRQARVAVDSSVQLGMGFLLKDDPRYRRAPDQGVAGRIGNAVLSAFTARNRYGGRMPAYSRFAGVAVSNMVSKTWLPLSRNSWGDVAARSGGQIGAQVGVNLLREFWPDLKRKFRK